MSKGHIYRNLLIMFVFVFVASFIFADLLRVRTTVASVMGLPEPTQLLSFSADTPTAVLRGLMVNPQNPLEFDFILEGQGSQEELRADASDMINYFLAALTFSKDSLWVNLSPYESDRIIEDSVAQTELGQDMLEQDYVLKQLVSSATYPKTDLGRDYWDMVNDGGAFESASFNKVWIVSKEASVIEHETMAVIEKAVLEAKTEQDYLAMQKNNVTGLEASSSAVNEFIIPKLNHELNNGSHFAKLRRMYSSIILATWFKQKFVDSFYSSYINTEKVSGIDTVDIEAKSKVYDLYTEAFKKGVYNLIKTERNADKQKIKRHYFSGGNKVAETMNLKTTQSSSVEELWEKLKKLDLYVANGFASIIRGPKAKSYAEMIEELDAKNQELSEEDGRVRESQANKAYMNDFAEIVNEIYGVKTEAKGAVADAVKYLTIFVLDFAGRETLLEAQRDTAYQFIREHSNASHDVDIEDFFKHVSVEGRLDNFQVFQSNKLDAINALFEGESEFDFMSLAKNTSFYKEGQKIEAATNILGAVRKFIADRMANKISEFNTSADSIATRDVKEQIDAKYNSLAEGISVELRDGLLMPRENVEFALSFLRSEIEMEGPKGLRTILNRKNNLINYTENAFVESSADYEQLLQSLAAARDEFAQFKDSTARAMVDELIGSKQANRQLLQADIYIFAEMILGSGVDSQKFAKSIIDGQNTSDYMASEVLGTMGYSVDELNEFVSNIAKVADSQTKLGGLFSSSVYAFDDSINLDEYLAEQGFDEFYVGSDLDIDGSDIESVSPFKHRFEDRDYARELVDVVIRKIALDADLINDGELSVEVVEGYMQDLIKGEIDLDKAVHLLKDSITKIELVRAIRESLNETLTLINYYDIFPVEFLEYRSLVPEYLALYDFIQDSEVVRESLSESELVETMFNIERSIAQFIYNVNFDELNVIQLNNFISTMRQVIDKSEEEVGILGVLDKVGYGELQDRISEKLEDLGMDIGDHGLFSSSVMQGGIDLKDIDVKSSKASSGLIEFASVDMSDFAGFSFTIQSVSKVSVADIGAMLGGPVNVF